MADIQNVVLKIRVLDAQGQFLGGTVDIQFIHRTPTDQVTQRGVDASQEIPITGLQRSPAGDYQVTVTPAAGGFAPQSQAITIPAKDSASLDFTFQKITMVHGLVSSPDRAGVGGLTVQILDRNVGQDVVLATATTDERGRYQVQFQVPSLAPQRKTRPDLQAKAYAGQTFLAASETRYDAGIKVQLDIRLPANSTTLPSEHETLTGDLAARYNGALRNLQETGDRKDITYLANKTGWDARAVAMAALADQFSQGTSVVGAATVILPPAFFYALFRAGLPANADTLYQSDIQVVTAIWKKAIAQGVIPASLATAIPDAAKRFQSLAAQKLLTGPVLTGVSSIKDMLAVSRLTSDQQQKFADLYTANRTDAAAFWKAVGATFGQDVSTRLQVDGKLALLTINNAPLMQALQKAGGASALSDPIQLAQAGYHTAAKWAGLLGANISIPKEIPGDTPQVKQANYAAYLAAQIRLSYPTASVAQMVQSDALKVGAKDQVVAFLTQHQGKFEIGLQPVEQYVKKNNAQISGDALAQVKRLQRVYQITPTDQAMSALLTHGLDAAYHVVRYDKDAFVRTFSTDLGGADYAVQVYDKAVQVHNAVLNISVGFLTARNGTPLGGHPLKKTLPGSDNSGQLLNPAPTPPTGANAADIIAYPTLEGLFGSMDFCACDECRSILSPAAYLVDLLTFIDQPAPPAGTSNPQTVLFGRRPDLQYLPLTCENTNTAMPYIDVVNETLEYFIANTVQKLSLNGYMGHDTDGSVSEDLLASPQFVLDSAYTTLRQQSFPLELPFHQPLENLRRNFDKFGVPLPLTMERFRQSDTLERGVNPYGWRDIWMEELRLSRDEYRILTDSIAVPIAGMYGFAGGTSNNDVIAGLSNTKRYTRRLEITYDDIVTILQTRFVNPSSDLIPKLERLGVNFAMLAELKTNNNAATDQKFDTLLPTGAGAPDPAEYGGDIKAWVKNDANYARIMGLITLTDPSADPDPCNFDNLEFRFAKPAANTGDLSTRIGVVEYARLLRFIRLWRKTSWTVEQTDAAICALYRTDLQPLGPGDIDTLAKLDAGFLTLLPRLGILTRVMNTLELTLNRDFFPLLACWSPLGTQGDNALYRRFFLNPALLKQDAVFADNGYGEFLIDATRKVADHAPALRSAFSLTGDEYDHIVAAIGFDANTPLTIPNISSIYRRGYLAKKLHTSVRELLLLIQFSGLDPFAPPNPSNPAILSLIGLVQELKARSLKSSAALYLIWNQDLSGKSAPTASQLTEFARTLRGDFTAIDDQFAATEDPGGDIARARMSLVYGPDAASAFFALLDNTLALDAGYTHPQPVLETAITTANPNIAYDDFRHRLYYTGVLTAAQRDALKAVAGVTPLFQQAVDALFARSEDAKGSFFARYPELQPLYDAYVASADPPETKRSALLAAFQPELSRRRKSQQALQRLSSAAGLDLTSTQILLAPDTPPYPLHSEVQAGQPALNDLLGVGTAGLAAQFFFADTASGAPAQSVAAASNLDYSAGSGNSLPLNPAPGAAISGLWSGLLEIPEAGFYNFVVDTDSGATVNLTLAGQSVPLIQNGSIWRNAGPLELKAGTLYDIVLKVEKVKNTVRVQWETPKQSRTVIPARYLYPASVLPPFSNAYVRFMKVASLVAGLSLTAGEMAHFATDPAYAVNGDGWLNALAVIGDPTPATAAALLRPFQALLDFARIKAEISPDDESLLSVLEDPATAAVTSDGLLFSLTRWDSLSLSDVLSRFGGALAGLGAFDLFRRVYDAFALIQTMGVRAAALMQASTNDPDLGMVRDFQAALIARYDPADWRDVIQPINDAMRGLQRDALVAYILHQFRSNAATDYIDTADKLFEYFLMDVQMEPCMLTSRIRHALSSVQLFIERCIMNLETDVSPAGLNSQQWEWMKRYRVWEANRKIFLFPENWLEPELRDDKSPFFKDIESQLLQSDITDDSAATALLNYLTKLEEVAKLQPCGIYHLEGDPALRTGDVDHVIARTAGAHRKYYYRRYEYGYWTPWEEVKLEIEDNPVIPVIWNDRLLLFWLKLMKKTPTDGPATSSSPDTPPTLSEMHLNDLKSDADTEANKSARVTMQATLYWSEYYNGKWQPSKTSEVTLPTTLTDVQEGESVAAFRKALTLSVAERNSVLRVSVDYYGGSRSSFLLYNTHSLPVRDEDQMKSEKFTPPETEFRVIFPNQGSLSINYYSGEHTVPVGPPFYDTILNRQVIKPPIRWTIVEPHHALKYPDEAPFFFEDSRHTFFVTTTETPVLIRDHLGYGIGANPNPKQAIEIPPLVLQVDPHTQVGPKFWGDGGPVGPDAGVVDSAPMQNFISEDAYIRRGLGSTGGVTYGGQQIGPSGSISTVQE